MARCRLRLSLLSGASGQYVTGDVANPAGDCFLPPVCDVRSPGLWAREERVRIARELHDVVAHALAVVTVQAGVGRRLMARRP
jgi:Histidine kinase